jgi:hypothetical protein
MAQSPVAAALAAHWGACITGADNRTGMPAPDPHLPRHTFHPVDLVIGQSQEKLRVDHNVSPKIGLSVLRSRAAPFPGKSPHKSDPVGARTFLHECLPSNPPAASARSPHRRAREVGSSERARPSQAVLRAFSARFLALLSVGRARPSRPDVHREKDRTAGPDTRRVSLVKRS